MYIHKNSRGQWVKSLDTMGYINRAFTVKIVNHPFLVDILIILFFFNKIYLI